MVTTFTDRSFKVQIVEEKKTFLVAFVAEKCSPCKLVLPILEHLAGKNPCIGIGIIDVSKYPQIAMQYSLGALPTLLLFSNGIVNQYVGKPTEEKISKFLAISL